MLISESRPEFEHSITFLRKELSHIMAGRAEPSLLEDVKVNVYDSHMKLHELASLSVPDPRSLLIEPWDKSVVKDVIAALKSANLEGQIQTSGDSIRFVVPQMTEDNRKIYVKVVKEKLEQARISIRKVRDKLKEKIIKEQKDKLISEDDKFVQLKQLDEMTNEFTVQVKDIGDLKEKQIFTI